MKVAVKRDEIKGEVETIARTYAVNEARAFAAYCLRFVHQIGREDAVEQTDTLQGSGGDRGLDGWHKSDETKEFFLWQCKWYADEKPLDISPVGNSVTQL